MKRRKQNGSAVLAVVFLGALLMIGTMAALLDSLTQGKREKEEELIWRGKQYMRGIRMYYRKMGRFPQNVEDLSEPKIGGIRFLRQAYKDPMDKEDGKWRFIYVGPSGELIGSLTRTTAIQLGAAQRVAGAVPAGAAGLQIGGPGGQPNPPGGGARQGMNIFPGGNVGLSGGNPGPGLSLGGDGKIIGGNIIGVASKNAASSLKVYKGGDTYKTWEFIWDPVADAAAGNPVPQTIPGGAPGFGQPIPTPPSPNGRPRRN
ncbi:MAG: hypothetical protein HY046_03080 [Acidobacteria bacterium]|nr:hypothetical protein [Acidobacteriota bacterium]